MKSLIPALFTVGALMVLFGAAVYITGWEPAPYVYTIGATMVALAQINSPSKTLAQVQHGFVENPRHHVDVLPQVAQDLPGVFRCIFKGDKLELHVGAVLLHPRPQVHQHLGRGHGGGADADDLAGLLHGVPCPGDGVFAVLDDVFGVLVQGLARLGQLQPPVGADKKLKP